jgi:branched-chain amino acid transport system ATP-binding protein
VLSLEAVDVSIKSVRILRGVRLRIAPGQMAGLIGRNGAGKTTLMRAVIGALPVAGGTIAVGGRQVERLAAHARARLGIGYMPEDRRIIPQLTVEENILLPAWAAGTADSAARLAGIYDRIPEIRLIRERRGLQLSGGQQKLTALARALMSGTKLLLLDEPFEGVAPVLAQRLAEVIGAFRAEGVAVLLSESDLSHSRKLLDVVFPIDRGEVGPPAAGAISGPPHPSPQPRSAP